MKTETLRSHAMPTKKVNELMFFCVKKLTLMFRGEEKTNGQLALFTALALFQTMAPLTSEPSPHMRSDD